jgi:peptide/nickel transport system permease protein
MGQFIIKRLALLIPTIFFVMFVAFFLSKLVPGDTADSMLALQGVRPESSNAAQEYKKHYLKLGLDLPLFYISIVPDFYPDNVNAIINPTDRYLVQQLLRQKVPFEYIEAYIRLKKTAGDAIKKSLINADTVTIEKVGLILSKIDFATEIADIQSLWLQLIPFKNKVAIDFSAINSTTQDLSLQRAKGYVPTIRWHGQKNQFHQWAFALFHGQLGISIKDGQNIGPKILSALKWTLFLSILNLILSSIISIPSGLIAGYWQNGIFDKISGFLWLIFYSIPAFWLASILIVYCTSDRYGTWLHIFPTPGSWYLPEGQSFFSNLSQYSHQIVLPIICLVANDIAQLSRIVRNNVIEQKTKHYVLMASAKGVNHLRILTKHIFPNLLLPLITVIGSRISAGLSGALIIEVIFNIPGMGRLMFDSIYSADWNVVFGILLIVSLITIISMLLTDIFYAQANPKIKSATA